ncbi:uncharacterized protein LOC121869650 [Homarus americanus]|uniref:uncharacterized protein LOC121869650 n=1 Tax=Homarus americanus TaxID=6706 RepID=UPI001C48D564|nr:uncharacterized protein LOC121869650 [Homarus americanus]
MMEKSGDWGSVPCGSDTLAFVICDFVPGYNPFVLVGPVVILSGVAVLILSIEVCIRRKEFKEKNLEAPVRVTTAKERWTLDSSTMAMVTSRVTTSTKLSTGPPSTPPVQLSLRRQAIPAYSTSSSRWCPPG